jgi:hypothetical protein
MRQLQSSGALSTYAVPSEPLAAHARPGLAPFEVVVVQSRSSRYVPRNQTSGSPLPGCSAVTSPIAIR